MKKSLYLITLLIIVAGACKQKPKTEAQRDYAIDSVETYISKKINDPKSYQSVSFGKLKPIDDNFGDTSSKPPYKTIGYTITHSYRAKNEFGELILYDQKFVMDTTLHVNEVRELPE